MLGTSKWPTKVLKHLAQLVVQRQSSYLPLQIVNVEFPAAASAHAFQQIQMVVCACGKPVRDQWISCKNIIL